MQKGAGETLARMMRNNPSNVVAQRVALATLAALSTSFDDEVRSRLGRHKDGVPQAIVSTLDTFPEDRRVRCEGLLVVQNLSFSSGGSRGMAKAGAVPVLIRLLRVALEIDLPTHGGVADGEARAEDEAGGEEKGKGSLSIARMGDRDDKVME